MGADDTHKMGEARWVFLVAYSCWKHDKTGMFILNMCSKTGATLTWNQHLGFCQRELLKGHPFLWATPLKSNAEVSFDSLAEMEWDRFSCDTKMNRIWLIYG